MTKRNEVIDIIRAICAIYIIAIFHLNSYYMEEYIFTGNWVVVSKMLTIISLGGFTFISGYCLSKYRFNELRDVRSFYNRRLSRFYFLYFMAAISLFMMKFIIGKGWFFDNTQFFLTLVGFSSFYNPIPHTLWYFGMIMFFYLLTPLLNNSSSSKKQKINFFAFTLIVLGLYDVFFYVDETLYLYYPFYFIGLIRPDIIFKCNLKRSLAFSLLSIICLSVLYSFLKSYDFLLLFEYLIIPPGLFLLISISRLLAKNKSITTFFTFVSTASMVAYLFHRHLYGVVCVVCSGNSSGPITPFAGLVGTIVLFVISYFIQVYYNKIINYITIKK